ncbi:hypothetical protein J2T57_003816 [Natronocella acetinitrilica]|uniref:Endonuclease/exonuclease/phosphatase domain-containing protein n=1 Tax=Natronocella acetinitrilica TaxID=414046 RepID=A0AAE3G698_9GAMM|nr:hypothetical protein [Natronocella acetinitrilica]
MITAGTCAELRLASWNIHHLGWDNDKSYEAVAPISAQLDFVAIQELNSDGLELLVETLERKTGEEWGKSKRKSRTFGRATPKEVHDKVVAKARSGQFLSANAIAEQKKRVGSAIHPGTVIEIPEDAGLYGSVRVRQPDASVRKSVTCWFSARGGEARGKANSSPSRV